MDNLLFAIRKPDGKHRRREDFVSDPQAGFGRLLVAATIIWIAAGLLDHAAAIEGKPDTVVGASYGSSTEGSSK